MRKRLIIFYLFMMMVPIFLINCGTKMTPEQMRAQGLDFANKEQFEDAVKAYEKLIKAYPDHEFAAEALYKIGLIYTKKIENPKKAADAFERLVKKFPNDPNADKGLYRLASIYSKNMADHQKAIDTFVKLIDTYPNSEYKTESQIWISYLYANDINDIPKAKENLEKYNFSATRLRQQAEVFEQNESFDSATMAYETIVHIYPDTVFADSLLFKLGTIYSNNLKNLNQSVDAYKRLVNGFPNSKLIVQSQFMIGYTYANLLKDLEKARNEYQIFLQKYPKNELAASVRWELDHLGKDISDIDFLSKDTKDNNQPAK